jgi:hypothetical protein
LLVIFVVTCIFFYCCYYPPLKFKFASWLSIFHHLLQASYFNCCSTISTLQEAETPHFSYLTGAIGAPLFSNLACFFHTFFVAIFFFSILCFIYFKSMRIFSCVHVSSISWLGFLFDFLFFHGIFISFPFIFSILTMLLKLPWLTIFYHLNLSFNF